MQMLILISYFYVAFQQNKKNGKSARTVTGPPWSMGGSTKILLGWLLVGYSNKGF